ncbi:MAG: hypothetical protein FJ033_12200 [Chloroflexi bacterium]|nr:hypothetical protein [Chloroflexota bacterium]
MKAAPNPAPERRRRTRSVVAAEPLTAYELVTRRAVEDLEREIARIDTKMNAPMVGMVVTVAAEVWWALFR